MAYSYWCNRPPMDFGQQLMYSGGLPTAPPFVTPYNMPVETPVAKAEVKKRPETISLREIRTMMKKRFKRQRNVKRKESYGKIVKELDFLLEETGNGEPGQKKKPKEGEKRNVKDRLGKKN